MPELSREPSNVDQQSFAALFSDLDGWVSEERILLGRRGDQLALRNIRRATVATNNMRFGVTSTPLDVWCADLDVPAEALGWFRQWLSNDELARAERFYADVHRARYIVGRATLRCVLADRLGCSPASIRFAYGTNGKPKLASGQGDVEFNLAHSGGEAVIALANDTPVGVDIESHRPIAEVELLARLVFSDVECHELELALDPVSTFLNGWTRKEAYVKALGLGLSAPLKEITVSLSDRPALFSTGFRDQSASNWRLLSVSHPRAVVAVALGPRHNGTTPR